ncbi:MAG: hypothetical protein NTY98_03125, partial [Verrucomicrobia bacterium]|nr:hypothetical protein [Verrucomicrobiota bacterium]
PPTARSRWAILGACLLLLLGLAWITLGWPDPRRASDEPQLGSMFIMYGSLMALYSLVYLGQVILASSGMRRPVAHEPVRLPRFGLALKILGIALFLSAHFYAIDLSDWLFGTSFTSRTDAMDRSMRGSAVAFILSLGGAIVLYLGYRFGLRGASSTAQGDTRPPAVYLRSFGDDGKNSLNPDTLTAKILGLRVWGLLEILGPIANLYPPRLLKLVLGSAADTAEEQLATYFRRQGPFVAIGKPGEWLATGGAERMYVSHETWKDTVLGLLGRCATVVLQPARTEGVWWEIETCIRQVQPGRLLLSFAAFDKSPQAYEEFRLRFEDLSQVTLPRTLGGAHFIWLVPGGHAMVLPSRYRTPLLWPLLGLGLDLKATLWPFLHHVYPEAHPTAPPPERPFLFATAKVAAVIAWSLLIIGGPLVVSNQHDVGRQFARFQNAPTTHHPGHAANYLMTLPTDWDEVWPPPAGCDVQWSSPGKLAVLTIQPVSQLSGDTQQLARMALHAMDQLSVEPATELSRRTVTRQGKEWLEVEVYREVPGSTFSQHQVFEFYSGPEGKFILSIATAYINVALFPGRVDILRQLAEGFQLPPPPLPAASPTPPPAAAGTPAAEDSSYTVQLSEGWRPATAENQRLFPQGRMYQYGEFGDATFGVVIEPSLPAGFKPKNWAELFKVQLEGNGGQDVQASEVKTVQMDGRSWVQFQLRARVGGLDLTYLYALHLGKDATCTTIGCAPTAHVKTHQPRIQAILQGLRLNFN